MIIANLKRMDWVLNGAVVILSGLSLLTLASIAPHLLWFQFAWFFLGFLIIAFFSQIDWRPLINYRWIVLGIYAAAILLLIVTFLFAPTIRGIRGWLVLGPVNLQSAELVKLALIIVFSYYFSHRHVGIALWQNILVPFVYFLIPAAFVLAHPDLGSVLVLFGIWIGYLLASGIRWRHLALGFLVIAILAVFGWHSFLENYQRERVIGLFNPDYDPLGVNYSVIQSKVAIGSAGFWGKGFKQGTQSQLGFLPEAATDFIFSAFAEEWGFAGAIILLAAFMLMLWRIIRIGLFSDTNFAKLVCLGAVMMFLIHFILNLGSELGLLPVIGIPLPFFSYGGSNLITSAALIGLAQSIFIRFRY